MIFLISVYFNLVCNLKKFNYWWKITRNTVTTNTEGYIITKLSQENKESIKFLSSYMLQNFEN